MTGGEGGRRNHAGAGRARSTRQPMSTGGRSRAVSRSQQEARPHPQQDRYVPPP